MQLEDFKVFKNRFCLAQKRGFSRSSRHTFCQQHSPDEEEFYARLDNNNSSKTRGILSQPHHPHPHPQHQKNNNHWKTRDGPVLKTILDISSELVMLEKRVKRLTMGVHCSSNGIHLNVPVIYILPTNRSGQRLGECGGRGQSDLQKSNFNCQRPKIDSKTFSDFFTSAKGMNFNYMLSIMCKKLLAKQVKNSVI